jgi:hypothetical protein
MCNFYLNPFSRRFDLSFIGKDMDRVFTVISGLFDESIQYFGLFPLPRSTVFFAVIAVNFCLSFKFSSIRTPVIVLAGIISLSLWFDFYYEASALFGFDFT